MTCKKLTLGSLFDGSGQRRSAPVRMVRALRNYVVRKQNQQTRSKQ